MTIADLIRLLTVLTIAGLLLSVGLKVKTQEILEAARRPALLARSLLANFVLAPLVILGLALVFELPTEISIGMILMAAAPFAPMAPAFAGIAKGDVPVAAGHMTMYCVLAVVLTPLLCQLLFMALPNAGRVEFDVFAIVVSLLLTVFFPLALGLAIHSFAPSIAAKLLRPVSAIALILLLALVAFVIFDQFEALSALGWRVFLAMLLSTEVPLLIGYFLGGPGRGVRRSIALGTSMRNMGVAFLIATISFGGTTVVISVIAYSLVVVIMGLGQSIFWGRRTLN